MRMRTRTRTRTRTKKAMRGKLFLSEFSNQSDPFWSEMILNEDSTTRTRERGRTRAVSSEKQLIHERFVRGRHHASLERSSAKCTRKHLQKSDCVMVDVSSA